MSKGSSVFPCLCTAFASQIYAALYKAYSTQARPAASCLPEPLMMNIRPPNPHVCAQPSPQIYAALYEAYSTQAMSGASCLSGSLMSTGPVHLPVSVHHQGASSFVQGLTQSQPAAGCQAL